jgi:hypothetical protein
VIQFISNYFALSGPAVLSALVASTIAYFALGGRDMSFPNAPIWQIAGLGVVAGMAVSVVLALAGFSSSMIPAVVGVAVGVGAAVKRRMPKP